MKMIIGDKFASASTGETIPVINPYDGSFIDDVPNASRDDINLAVEYALQAQKKWKKVPVYQKQNLSRNF